MGGKTRTAANGKVAKGWDHDPPAKEKLVPFGIVMRVTGALMLLFGSHETSDAWVDALQMWWLLVQSGLGANRQLIAKFGRSFFRHLITPTNGSRNRHIRRQLVSVPPCTGRREHPGGVASEAGR